MSNDSSTNVSKSMYEQVLADNEVLRERCRMLEAELHLYKVATAKCLKNGEDLAKYAIDNHDVLNTGCEDMVTQPTQYLQMVSNSIGQVVTQAMYNDVR